MADGDHLFWGPLDGMALLLSKCTSFQTAVSAADDTEALEKIHYPYTNDDVDPGTNDLMDPRPRAIIQPGPDFRMKIKGIGRWSDVGSLALHFEFLPTVDTDGLTVSGRQEDLKLFMTTMGTILLEIAQKARTYWDENEDSFLWISEILKIDGPAECQVENETQLFYGVSYMVYHGDWTEYPI